MDDEDDPQITPQQQHENAQELARQLVAGQFIFRGGNGNAPAEAGHKNHIEDGQPMQGAKGQPNQQPADGAIHGKPGQKGKPNMGFDKFGKLPNPVPNPLNQEDPDAHAQGQEQQAQHQAQDPIVAFMELLKQLKQQNQPADPEKLRQMVKEEVAKLPPKVIEIRQPDKPAIQIDSPHKQFEQLLKLVKAGTPVWVTGPAGSGKSHAGELVAKALGLDFHPQSFCQQTGLHHLIGYTDAGGTFHETPFTKAFRNGGLNLWDEIDRSNPNVVLALNSATSNGFSTFGNGEHVRKHPDFHVVAAANTWGTGPNAEYVGACKADAAVLDRFQYLPWDYDTELELELTGRHKLCHIFHRARKVAQEKGIRVIISTRKILNAIKVHQYFPIGETLKFALGGITEDMFNQLFGDAVHDKQVYVQQPQAMQAKG
jgi:hypothetical protein